MTDTVITLSDVSFTYETSPILEHLSLSVHQGDFLGIIGPNGSGKTTLLKLMLGLLKPDTGSIHIFGEPIESFTRWMDIGYVPQRAGLTSTHFPITVEEIVHMGRIRNNHFGFFTTQDHSAVTQALDQVGLLPLRNSILHHLSGGQQQKVFIARALVSHPKLLILDEPTVGIDQESQSSFYELLHTLNKEQGITLILISHDIDTISKEVTTVACLKGPLICHGKPSDVFNEKTMKHIYGKYTGKIIHE